MVTGIKVRRKDLAPDDLKCPKCGICKDFYSIGAIDDGEFITVKIFCLNCHSVIRTFKRTKRVRR